MAAMTTATRMTAEDYLALPPDRRWLELVDGEVIVNDPAWLHNRAHSRLVAELWNWTQAVPGRGAVGVPLDVLLNELNVFSPDVVWYAEERVPGKHDPPPYPLPDLAIEIRSPSTWRFDIGAKKATYERHGLRELWLVDTAAEAVLVFRRSTPKVQSFDLSLELRRGQALDSPVLPGFSLALDDLFGEA